MTDQASWILSYLPPEDALRLTHRLPTPLARGLLEQDSPAPANAIDRCRALRDLLGMLQPTAVARSTRRVDAAHGPRGPYTFLERASVELVANELERESPLLIASLLTQLPLARAATLLSRLAAPLREQVLRELEELRPLDLTSVQQAAARIQERLATQGAGIPW